MSVFSEKRATAAERGERGEGRTSAAGPPLSPDTLERRNVLSRHSGRDHHHHLHREELFPQVSSSSPQRQGPGARSPTLPLAVARHHLHHHGKETTGEGTSSESPSPERVTSAGAAYHHHGGGGVGKKRGSERGRERERDREGVFDGHQSRPPRSRLDSVFVQ